MSSTATRNEELNAPPTIQDVIEALATLEDLLTDTVTWDDSYDLVQARRVLIEPTVIILKGRHKHAGYAFNFSEQVYRWLDIVKLHREYFSDSRSKLDLSLLRYLKLKGGNQAAAEKPGDKVEVTHQDKVAIEAHGAGSTAPIEGKDGTKGEHQNGKPSGTGDGRAHGSGDATEKFVVSNEATPEKGTTGTRQEGGKGNAGQDKATSSTANIEGEGGVGRAEEGDNHSDRNKGMEEEDDGTARGESHGTTVKGVTGNETGQQDAIYDFESAGEVAPDGQGNAGNGVREGEIEDNEAVDAEENPKPTVGNVEADAGVGKTGVDAKAAVVEAGNGVKEEDIVMSDGEADAEGETEESEGDRGRRPMGMGGDDKKPSDGESKAMGSIDDGKSGGDDKSGTMGSDDDEKAGGDDKSGTMGSDDEEEAGGDDKSGTMGSDDEEEAGGDDASRRKGGLPQLKSPFQAKADDKKRAFGGYESSSEDDLPQVKSPFRQNIEGKKRRDWTWDGIGSDADDNESLPQLDSDSQSEGNTAGEKRGASSRDDTDARSKRRKIQETPPKARNKGKAVDRPECYPVPCSQCLRTRGEVCWKQPAKDDGSRGLCCQPCKEKKRACTYSAPRKPRTRRVEVSQQALEGSGARIVGTNPEKIERRSEAPGVPPKAWYRGPKLARAQSERADRPLTAAAKRKPTAPPPSRPLLGNVTGSSRMQDGPVNDDWRSTGNGGQTGTLQMGGMKGWEDAVHRAEERRSEKPRRAEMEDEEKPIRDKGKARAIVMPGPNKAESSEGVEGTQGRGKGAPGRKAKTTQKQEGAESSAMDDDEELPGFRPLTEEVERLEQGGQFTSTTFRWGRPGDEFMPEEIVRLQSRQNAFQQHLTQLDSRLRVNERKVPELKARVVKAEAEIRAMATGNAQDRGAFHEQLQRLGGRINNNGTEFHATNAFVEEVSKHLATVESHHAVRLQQLEEKINTALNARDGAPIISKVQDLLALHRQEVKQDMAEVFTEMRSLQREQQAAIATLTSTLQNVLIPQVQAPFSASHSNPRIEPHASQSTRQVSAPPTGWGRSYSENPSGPRGRPSFHHSNSYSGAGSTGEQTSRQIEDRQLPLPSANQLQTAFSAPVGAHHVGTHHVGAHQSMAGDQTRNEVSFHSNFGSLQMQAPFPSGTVQPTQASNLAGGQFNMDFGGNTNEQQVTLPPISTIAPQAPDSSSAHPLPDQSNEIIFQNFTGEQGGLRELTDHIVQSTANAFPPSISQRLGGPSNSNTAQQGGASRVSMISSVSTASGASTRAAFASAAPHPSMVMSYGGSDIWDNPPSPMTETPPSFAPPAAQKPRRSRGRR